MNNKNKTDRNLTFYLGLRYPVTIHQDPDGGFVAEIEELPGCITQAETLEDVYAAIEDARQAWLEAAYEDGRDIPLPRDMQKFSGRFLVRMPRSLHRDLVSAAKQQGVSLNQYVTGLLAAGLQRGTIEGQLSLVLSKVHMIGLYPDMPFGYEGNPIDFSQYMQLTRKELVK